MRKKKTRLKGRLLAVLLAAVLTVGNMSPSVLAASDRMAEEGIGLETEEETAAFEEEAVEADSEPEEEGSGEVSAPEGEAGEETAAPESGNDGETPPPEDGNDGETSAPEGGSAEETPVPEEGSAEETPDSESGSDGETSAPEGGSGEETIAPEDGEDGETLDPDDGSDGETSIPESGEDGNTSAPEEGDGENKPVPEDGNGEETSNPEAGKDADTAVPEDGGGEGTPVNGEEDPEGTECNCGSETENALLHSWDCPVFQAELLQQCDCGVESGNLADHAYDCNGVLSAFEALCGDDCGAYGNQAAAHSCEVLDRLLEALCTCESDSRDYTEHEEDCTYYKYMYGSFDEVYGVAECTCGSEEENALLHSWGCPVFQEAFLELCDCGSDSEELTDHAYECTGVLKAFAALCDDDCGAYENQAAAHRCRVQDRLIEALCTCGSDSDEFSEHEEDCAYYQYLLGSVNDLYEMEPLAVTEKQSGTPLSSSSVTDWTYNAGPYSFDYMSVRFRDGISSVSTWADSGANITQWTNTTGEPCLSMHPNDDSGSTKNHFGALYSKVVYDGFKWYDMKITVVNYSNSAVASDGSKVTVRPGIKFSKSRIAFYTTQKVGGVRVKVEFFETGTNTSANLKLRFQWWDIDDSQRFGFSATNAAGERYATVDHKYYKDANTVVNRSYDTVLGANMEVLIGPSEQWPKGTEKETQAVFELSNCKGFFMSFGPEDNIGDTYHQYVYTKAYYTQMEAAMVRGRNTVTVDHNGDGVADTLYTINDLLVVTDVSGLINTPAPTKQVSNDRNNWGTSNTLATTTSEYYYRIRQYVPWQDDNYRYSSFILTDSLPAGVDYVSFHGAVDEAGTDWSDQFSYTIVNDVLTATAKNPSAADFAGHWYTFTIKVKMDPTEINPAYSGNTATYTVQNTGNVTVKNGTVTTSNNTNTVTTTAKATAPTVPAPTKYVSNDGNNWNTSNTLPTTTSEYYYKVIQQVPDVDYAYRYEAFTMRDSLPAGADYVSLVGIGNESGEDKSGLFSVSAVNDVLTIAALNPSTSGLAGHTYTFLFKVKMDPTEITPAYSGNTAAYTVRNAASVAVKNAGISAVTKTTNTVTTTAVSTRPTPEAPKKGINQDENLAEHTLSYASDDFVFSIFQKVPAYDALWEPCAITMTDVLEDCLQYVGCTVNLDGTELADGWTVSVTRQTVTVTGNDKMDYSGKTLRFDITCRVKDGYDLTSYQSIEDGDIVATIPNKAKVKFVWSNASTSTVEKETNTVRVKLKENAVNLIIRKTSEDTGEDIPGAVFAVYEWDGNGYNTSRGIMAYNASKKEYRMEQLVRTDANAGRFKVVEAGVPHGYVGSWEKEFTVTEALSGGTTDLAYDVTNKLQRCRIILYKENEAGARLEDAVFEIKAGADIVSPQGTVLVKEGTVVDTLTTDQDGTAVSKELYKGEYIINETKAPDGYVIGAPEGFKPGDGLGLVFLYDPGTEAAEVEEEEVTFIDPMATVHLQITKEIDTADIVWAHGNPTFLFKVEGTDLCGNTHTYYDAVEFTRDNIGDGEKASLTAEFTMPSGTYEATEELTMRYELDSIHSITGGKLDGEDAVTFDLSDGIDGAATFYNKKTTDEDLSHTVLVRNVMKEE